ncbi:hypothetical protein ACJ2A9_14145 [Anaerobacillus sp. MEB173]|uniref:hypothetical protein n=1 Tax=Anaerobacillus sp. MEB173 TaxID=3383345 RepID=UPI003F91513E
MRRRENEVIYDGDLTGVEEFSRELTDAMPVENGIQESWETEELENQFTHEKHGGKN